MDKSNPVGKKFNKLTVIEFSHSDALQHRMWKCICECGKEKIIPTRLLGKQVSCGCFKNQGTFSGVEKITGTLYCNMSCAAKRRGINFAVSVEYLWDLFIKQNKKCALSGLDLDFGIGKDGKNRTASLDRIDSNKDYIEGNVQWVHRRINVMKQDMTTEQFIVLCNLVTSKFKGTEVKETNPETVDFQSVSESLIVPAINYYRRKRREPRRISLKKQMESGKIPPPSAEEEMKVVKMYKEGYTIRAISAETNINRCRVSWVLKKHNVQITRRWKGKKTEIIPIGNLPLP